MSPSFSARIVRGSGLPGPLFHSIRYLDICCYLLVPFLLSGYFEITDEKLNAPLSVSENTLLSRVKFAK